MTNLGCASIRTRINSHNAFLSREAGHVHSAGLNNAVVFHERNRVAARYTRFAPARQSTARWGGGGRLETYYANVFFIQELRPGSDRPCRDIANKFSFHRVFARATFVVSEDKKKAHRGKLSFIPECKLP